MVIFLMDMAVKDSYVGVLKEYLGCLCSVGGSPVPLRLKIEQRPMGEYDDFRIRFLLAEILLQPLQLRVA